MSVSDDSSLFRIVLCFTFHSVAVRVSNAFYISKRSDLNLTIAYGDFTIINRLRGFAFPSRAGGNILWLKEEPLFLLFLAKI